MWIWLVVAVVAVIGEMLSYDLFLASVAAAAIAAGVMTPFLSVAPQLVVFAILSLVGIVFLRPAVKHALGIESRAHEPETLLHSQVIGRRGIVTQTVDARGGQVRIGAGEFWTARALDPEETLAAGTEVEVVVLDGLAVLVEPASSSLTEAELSIGAGSTTAPGEKGMAS